MLSKIVFSVAVLIGVTTIHSMEDYGTASSRNKNLSLAQCTQIIKPFIGSFDFKKIEESLDRCSENNRKTIFIKIVSLFLHDNFKGLFIKKYLEYNDNYKKNCLVFYAYTYGAQDLIKALEDSGFRHQLSFILACYDYNSPESFTLIKEVDVVDIQQSLFDYYTSYPSTEIKFISNVIFKAIDYKHLSLARNLYNYYFSNDASGFYRELNDLLVDPNNSDILEFLITENKFEYSKIDPIALGMVICASIRDSDINFIKLLIEHDIIDKQQYAAIMRYFEFNDSDVFPDEYCVSFYHLAILYGEFDIAELLSRSNPEYRKNDLKYALYLWKLFNGSLISKDILLKAHYILANHIHDREIIMMLFFNLEINDYKKLYDCFKKEYKSDSLKLQNLLDDLLMDTFWRAIDFFQWQDIPYNLYHIMRFLINCGANPHKIYDVKGKKYSFCSFMIDNIFDYEEYLPSFMIAGLDVDSEIEFGSERRAVLDVLVDNFNLKRKDSEISKLDAFYKSSSQMHKAVEIITLFGFTKRFMHAPWANMRKLCNDSNPERTWCSEPSVFKKTSKKSDKRVLILLKNYFTQKDIINKLFKAIEEDDRDMIILCAQSLNIAQCINEDDENVIDVALKNQNWLLIKFLLSLNPQLAFLKDQKTGQSYFEQWIVDCTTEAIETSEGKMSPTIIAQHIMSAAYADNQVYQNDEMDVDHNHLDDGQEGSEPSAKRAKLS